MTEQFVGTCQCGAVAYRVSGESVNLFICHCTQCQKQSSSAFGMALWVKNYVIESLVGSLGRWRRDTPAGHELIGEFCVECGTRVFHRHSANEKILSIKPGTLDLPKSMTPTAHIWTSEAQDWFSIPSDVLTYSENPPDFEEMFQVWRDSHELDNN